MLVKCINYPFLLILPVIRFSLLVVFLLFFTSQFACGASVGANGSREKPQLEPPKVKYEKAKVINAERIEIDDGPDAQLKEKH